MRGIVGEVRFGSGAIDAGALTGIGATMRRRGPDGSGLFPRDRVALAPPRNPPDRDVGSEEEMASRPGE